MAVKEFLRDLSFFNGMMKSDIDELAKHAEVLKLPVGSLLLKEGEKNRDIYFLVSGRIEITMKVNLEEDEEINIYRLKPGEAVGEFAFIDGSPRSANALVDKEAVVVKFDYKKLNDLFDTHPRLGYLFMKKLAKSLTDRIRRSNISQRNLFIW
jgi:CRP/FNR family transcriptional regulator, cyclic AMP receptor protein